MCWQPFHMDQYTMRPHASSLSLQTPTSPTSPTPQTQTLPTPHTNIVIHDLRFPNELAALRQITCGALVTIHVEEQKKGLVTDTHISESFGNFLQSEANFIIENNRDLHTLRFTVERILQQMYDGEREEVANRERRETHK